MPALIIIMAIAIIALSAISLGDEAMTAHATGEAWNPYAVAEGAGGLLVGVGMLAAYL